MNPSYRTVAWKISVTIVFVWLIIWNAVQKNQIYKQQRQIDQLCDAAFAMAQIQGATKDGGFEGGKEYCFFFGDYDRGMALVGEFDGHLDYRKKPQLIIMRNINERLLDEWNQQPLEYERYRKIR